MFGSSRLMVHVMYLAASCCFLYFFFTFLLLLLHLTSHPSLVLPLMRFLNSSLSPDTSCDLDPIPTSLLKQCSHILLPTITNIINLFLSTGIFPDQFKNCYVHPHLKNLTSIKMILVIIFLYLISHSCLNSLKEQLNFVLSIIYLPTTS